jgi:hypothetical protein
MRNVAKAQAHLDHRPRAKGVVSGRSPAGAPRLMQHSGGARKAAALVLATQHFVANSGGGIGSGAAECCIAGAGRRRRRRVGRRGSWCSSSQLSQPRRQTSECSGRWGGLAPRARRLVLVQLDSERSLGSEQSVRGASALRAGGPAVAARAGLTPERRSSSRGVITAGWVIGNSPGWVG